jgi:hypothetical protein
VFWVQGANITLKQSKNSAYIAEAPRFTAGVGEIIRLTEQICITYCFFFHNSFLLELGLCTGKIFSQCLVSRSELDGPPNY